MKTEEWCEKERETTVVVCRRGNGSPELMTLKLSSSPAMEVYGGEGNEEQRRKRNDEGGVILLLSLVGALWYVSWLSVAVREMTPEMVTVTMFDGTDEEAPVVLPAWKISALQFWFFVRGALPFSGLSLAGDGGMASLCYRVAGGVWWKKTERKAGESPAAMVTMVKATGDTKKKRKVEEGDGPNALH